MQQATHSKNEGQALLLRTHLQFNRSHCLLFQQRPAHIPHSDSNLEDRIGILIWTEKRLCKESTGGERQARLVEQHPLVELQPPAQSEKDDDRASYQAYHTPQPGLLTGTVQKLFISCHASIALGQCS